MHGHAMHVVHVHAMLSAMQISSNDAAKTSPCPEYVLGICAHTPTMKLRGPEPNT